MKPTRIEWISIVLDAIVSILATAIIVLILIGNAENTSGDTKEVNITCDCTCSVEEPTEPMVTEPPIETTEPTEVPTTEKTEPDNIYLGEFRLTAYCPCAKCNGQWAGGITSTGVMAQVGRTIAVDPKVIPYGTEVIINGHTYVAEDCGSAIKGNRIDIYHDTHEEAMDFGIQYADVYIVGE